jgi:hypothetical protein
MKFPICSSASKALQLRGTSRLHSVRMTEVKAHLGALYFH